MGDLKNLQIEGSDQFRSGGCTVETQWNAIDASIETQLKGLYDALMGVGTQGASHDQGDNLLINASDYRERFDRALQYDQAGKVTKSLGYDLRGLSSECRSGKCLSRSSQPEQTRFEAEVIGFRDKKVMLMPFDKRRE